MRPALLRRAQQQQQQQHYHSSPSVSALLISAARSAAHSGSLGTTNPHVGMHTHGSRRQSHIIDPAMLRAAQQEKDLRAAASLREAEANYDRDEAAKQDSRAHKYSGASASQYDGTDGSSSPVDFARERELYEIKRRREELKIHREGSGNVAAPLADPESATQFEKDVAKMREEGTLPPWARFRSPHEIFKRAEDAIPAELGEDGLPKRKPEYEVVEPVEKIHPTDLMKQRQQQVERRRMERIRRLAQEKQSQRLAQQQRQDKLAQAAAATAPTATTTTATTAALDGEDLLEAQEEHDAAADPESVLSSKERVDVQTERIMREEREKLKPGKDDGIKRDPKQEFASRVGYGADELEEEQDGGLSGFQRGSQADQLKQQFEEELRRRRLEERRRRQTLRTEREIEKKKKELSVTSDEAERSVKMAASVQKRIREDREKREWEETKSRMAFQEKATFDDEQAAEAAKSKKTRALEFQQTLDAKESPFGTRQQQLRHVDKRGEDGTGEDDVYVVKRWVRRKTAENFAIHTKPQGALFHSETVSDDELPVKRSSAVETKSSATKPLPFIIVCVADPTLPWRMFKRYMNLKNTKTGHGGTSKKQKFDEQLKALDDMTEDDLMGVKDEMAVRKEKLKLIAIREPVRAGDEERDSIMDDDDEVDMEARRIVLRRQREKKLQELLARGNDDDDFNIDENDPEYYITSGDQYQVNNQILAQGAANCIIMTFFIVFLMGTFSPFG